jgi:hypothetical protein
MKKILIFIYALLILTPQMAFSEITEMVPCSRLYELTPKVIKIHHDILRRELRLATQGIIKPIFIMYESPAFEPESILVLYKDRASYKLEVLQFDRSLWSQINQQISDSKNKNYSSDQIKISYNLLRNSKTINGETATIIKKAIDLVFKNARNPTEEESKSGKNYLDGTVFTFEPSNGECGTILGSYEGNAKRFLEIALLLKQYIISKESSQSNIENKIINLTNEFINNIL